MHLRPSNRAAVRTKFQCGGGCWVHLYHHHGHASATAIEARVRFSGWGSQNQGHSQSHPTAATWGPLSSAVAGPAGNPSEQGQSPTASLSSWVTSGKSTSLPRCTLFLHLQNGRDNGRCLPDFIERLR